MGDDNRRGPIGYWVGKDLPGVNLSLIHQAHRDYTGLDDLIGSIQGNA